MADLIQIENFINKYNDNVLSVNSLLKNSPTVNFNSNTGSHSITNENSYSSQSNCLEFTEVQNVVTGSYVTFDFGDALKYTTVRYGSYIFQYSVFTKTINASSLPMDFKLNLFVNSVLIETFTTNIDIATLDEGFYYTFTQSFNVIEDSEINFSFVFEAPSVGTPNPNFTFSVGGFKLEIDDKFIGLPTPYSLPFSKYNKENYVIKNENYTILNTDDFIEAQTPSIVFTLPTASDNKGKCFSIDNNSGGTITVNTVLSQTISGESLSAIDTIVLADQEVLSIISNGINFRLK